MLRVVDDELRKGSKLGGFILEERLGSGATGVVYRAHRDGQAYAVKVLARDLANADVLKKRFEREARILRKLNHPGIVAVEAFGIEGPDAYIVMELLEGETLEECLARGPLAPEETLAVLQQVLLALAHAHEKNVAHRDLKPANVFLVEGSQNGAPDVRILDFGLAKFLSGDESDQEGTLTRKGRVVGTPAYMAPEQITGVSVDERVDVYAAGVMLYELIADERPFAANKRSELLRAHLFEDVPPFSEFEGLSVDRKLEAMVRRALAKDPARRFASAQKFHDALARFSAKALGPGVTRRRTRSKANTSSVFIEAQERDAAAKAARRWHQAPWFEVAIWVAALLCFGLVVATMAYSGIAIR